ncbi:endonuclease III [Pacificimonas sp. WHA3]|uniref:Endonuclease III n=1 Tax=Pacificimonas pallii TaxID=2827236 RepID=A0ABS6SC48_9SPHN|nr:endonuclease III [Pacificimonas pallii]MBV7255437.1 endonuclease III [Pacificimonas pallii]
MAKAKKTLQPRELASLDVETMFRRLSDAMPGNWRDDHGGAKGPKGQPDAFRACVACMLSAQSLDTNTAKAAEQLFAIAKTPEAMLALDDDTLIDAIRPAGLYNNKAKSIRKFCAALMERGGTVPESRAGLMEMPGIGRKCADIVMSFTFGANVIAVDTHVGRVCNRTGLAPGKTEAKVAERLDKRAPEWAKAEGHFWLIQFGKKICTSRAPKCSDCFLRDLCLWENKAR